MYKRIVIATDGSEAAAKALEHGLRLARLAEAEVTVVTATEPATVIGAGYASITGTVFDPVPELIRAQAEGARAVLAAAEARANEAGAMTVDAVLVEDSYPAEAIVSTAERVGADLIVMGSHGRRGIGRLLLGSQTMNVLAHTKIPVLVTR